MLRLIIIEALGNRADFSASLTLLRYLNEKNGQIRRAAYHAIIKLLTKQNILPTDSSVLEKVNIYQYAKKAINEGRVENYEKFGLGYEYEVHFLKGLVEACLNSIQSLPQIMDTIDALTYSSGSYPGAPARKISLIIALFFADVMKNKGLEEGALAVYHNALPLSHEMGAPQMEWRIWFAIAKLLERQNDHKALKAFQNGMEVIDRMWFALLEEDKLRDFFYDKAELYERASLCCLRLRHYTFAFEILEKAKTRYLGDLIARRQMDPKRRLAREIQEFWRSVKLAGKKAKEPTRAQSEAGSNQMVIQTVETGSLPVGERVMMPRYLIKFLRIVKKGKGSTDYFSGLIEKTWKAISGIHVLQNEEFEKSQEENFYEIIEEGLEEIYQSIFQWDSNWEDPYLFHFSEFTIDQDRYTEAARKLLSLEVNFPLWVFHEYREAIFSVIFRLKKATEFEEEASHDREELEFDWAFIRAFREALNFILKHEPVIGEWLDEPDSPGLNALIFHSGNQEDSAEGRKSPSSIVEDAWEKVEKSRWRYIAQLARGESIGFMEALKSLEGLKNTAQLEYQITEFGTVVYILYSRKVYFKNRGFSTSG